MLGLSEDQTVWALGNAGTQCPGSGSSSRRARCRSICTPHAPRNRAYSPRFSPRRASPGPTTSSKGRRVSTPVLQRPRSVGHRQATGSSWELTNTSIKPWPCCRHTHPTIDAAIELHGKLGGAPIASVEVGAYQAALDVCDTTAAAGPYSAKFSLQHCARIALEDGQVVQSSFDAAARERIGVQRCEGPHRPRRPVDAAYPKSWGTMLRVETADGQVFEASRHDAKGDPENPVDASGISAKARMLLTDGGMAGPTADALIRSILDLVDDRRSRASTSSTGEPAPMEKADVQGSRSPRDP